MQQALISAENLVFKRRHKAILDGACIELNAGEVVALIGANGVGKTTLFHLLSGYLQPDYGQVQLGCRRERIALLPDKPALYPDWTVKEALSRIAQLYAADATKVDTLCAEFELNDVLNQCGKALSHGYRQRLSMAQMLLSDPQIMLLDEPGNGLDYRQKRALWPLLARLKSRGGVLLISHDWSEVAAVADRVYLLHQGKCKDVPLPPRVDGWQWLIFPDAATASAATSAAQYVQGRFVAIDATSKYDIRDVVGVSQNYPAEALQEQIDALA